MRSLEVGGAKAGSFTVHELIGAQVLSVWNFSLFSLSRLPSEPQDALLPIWISSCLLGFPPSAPGNLVVSPVLGVTLGGFWAGSLPVAQTWPEPWETCPRSLACAGKGKVRANGSLSLSHTGLEFLT